MRSGGGHNEIVYGHGRYEALKQLGYEEVDCVRLDHLSDAERKAFALVDNKLTMNSDFDFNILDAELSSIDLDLSAYDFNLNEYDSEDYGTDFELKDGDREPIQNMSITFSDEQMEVVKDAISKMKGTQLYKDYENINKNSNGNALYLVVLQWTQSRI